MRRLVVLGAVLVAFAPAVASFAQTAQPALDKYGWWNVNQALPADPTGGLLPPAVTVPPPPTAPADGLYVEQGPNGVAAIAAVHYFTGGDVDASLTLAFADGATAPQDVTLAACPAGGGWDEVQNGRWDRRPTYDPANCTFLGTVHPDTVTFSIPAAAHEAGSGFLSLVVVPAEGSGIFNVAFEAPTAASLVTRPAATPEAPPSVAPAPASDAMPLTFGGDAYAAPTFDSPTTAPAPTTPQAAPPRRAALRAPGEDRETSDRVVAVLLLIAGALVFVPRRWFPSLGAAGNSSARGLGRFTRDRAAPPNRI